MKKNRDTKDYFCGKKIAEEAIDVARGNFNNKEHLKNYIEKNSYSSQITYLIQSSERLSAVKSIPNPSQKIASVKMLEKKMLKRKKVRKLRTSIISAATIAAVVSIASFVLYYNGGKSEPTPMAYNLSVPTLILDHGEKIDLSNDTINIEVANKESKNTLTYAKASENLIDSIVRYNTMVIPSKFTYNIILEDGTEVFLNSRSSLKYPEIFRGDRREVFLDGEAYFKVKKSNRPFVVTTKYVDIKVYGTEFNVRTTSDDLTEMVLVTGSVGINPRGVEGDETMIKPEEICYFNNNTKKVSVERVNVEDYTAWRNGKFRYFKQPFRRVLDDLSSWYGVEIKATKEIAEMMVTMNFNRTTSFDEVILFIEAIIECKIIKEREEVYMVE